MQFGRSKYCLKSRKSSNDWDQRCDMTSTYFFQSRSSTVAQCNRRSTISWIGCFAFIYSILVYAFQFCNFAIELRQQSQNIANIFLKLFDHLSILSLTNNNNLKFAKIKKKNCFSIIAWHPLSNAIQALSMGCAFLLLPKSTALSVPL